MAMIDDFKANLQGGGARQNQYRVTITAPTGIAIDLDVTRASYMVKATNLPSMVMTPIEVPFRGRKIYIAGDRDFPDEWTTTFINDTDFMIRNAMERWSNGINDLAKNTGVVRPSDYQADLIVEQLDRDDAVLKSYKFINAWPTSIALIELTSDAADALEEFAVTWRYQHFETSNVSGNMPSFSVTGTFAFGHT